MESVDLIGPVKLEEFFATYWETQPLFVSRADNHYFSDLLSVESIKSYVCENAVSFPDVQIVNARSSVPVDEYTNGERRINADQLFEHHERGGTVIVSSVHEKFPAMGVFCQQINKRLQLRCQANAYLSPPGNQGFHSHYDTHDVFVLQVAGRKTFRFYPSEIELPFTDDTFHPDNHTEDEVVEEVELSAGDTLYIPRGMVHDALADEGEPSLHITLGVFPFVVRDLLQEMIQVAAEQDVSLRSSVDLTALQLTSERLEAIKQSVFTHQIYTEACSRLVDEVAVECLPVTAEFANANAAVVDTSVVSVNETAIHNTEHRDGVLKVRLAGQVIKFSDPMDTAVAALLGRQTMKVSALPGLDVEQRLALCQQLADAGVVSVE